MGKIYLDNAATTKIDPPVLEEMLPYLGAVYGNASRPHAFGREARMALELARSRLASCLGTQREEEIVFTGGGTEANNLAIIGVALANRHRGNHIITSNIEHKSVLGPCNALTRLGFRVSHLPVSPEGVVAPAALAETLSDDTLLVSIMQANNETGALQPVEKLAHIARNRGVLFHTDAIQSVGKLAVNVGELGVDLLSLSAHKFHGPKGVGALYRKSGVKISPLLLGGEHEYGLRPGTENVAGIAGLGRALELALQRRSEDTQHICTLRDRLYLGISRRLRDVQINGPQQGRLPGILNLLFPGIEGEALALRLDLQGIAVGVGAACASGSLEPSHTLLAMGLSRTEAMASVRFSLSRFNIPEEIDIVVREVLSSVEALKPVHAG